MASILRALPRVESLSEREREIFSVMTGGASDREVAERMHITIRTAKWHLANIRKKLGGLTRLQLCILAAAFHLNRLCAWCHPGKARKATGLPLSSHATYVINRGTDGHDLRPEPRFVSGDCHSLR